MPAQGRNGNEGFNMIKAERQAAIQGIVERQGSASVKDIAEELAVSEMTVRRDLMELSQAGDLERVHGGARSVASRRASMLRREYSHAEKRKLHEQEKRAIARRAVALIEPDSTIFLGTGTTVEQMAPLLPDCHLRIVTNSLSVFSLLDAQADYDLCLIGGMYRPRTAAFVGPLAEEAIAHLGIDAAFIGANGIFEGSVFTSNAEEGRFQQLAYNNADARYLLADASKIGQRDFYAFYHLIEIDALICEEELSDEARAGVVEYTEVLS